MSGEEEMTPSTVRLKQLAEAAKVELRYDMGERADFHEVANPEAVLRLIARIEKLEAALQFYAGTDCYAVVCDDGSVDGHSEEVPGTIAREALKEET